jgi:membrane fusion protein (multidrug efflux system)
MKNLWGQCKQIWKNFVSVKGLKKRTGMALLLGVVVVVLFVRLLGPFWKKGAVTPRYRLAPLVTVVPVQQGKIARSELYAGIVKAENAVYILSEFQGRIKDILFKDGDRVRKGDVLVLMEDSQARAAVQTAEAQLKLQAIERKKNKILVEKHVMSSASLEAYEARYDEAKARLENAKVSLEATRIKAPFDGIMGLLKVSVGSHVSPHQDIARIVSDKRRFIEFQIPEKEVRNVRVGQDLSVLSKGFDLLPVYAKISAISPYSDPGSHTVQVRALLEEGASLQDGAFAEVRIDLGEEERAVTVPQEAFESLDSDYLYVLHDGKAMKKNVVKGYAKDGMVQVVYGLNVGEMVIVDPVSSLNDGVRVRIGSNEQP